MFVKEKPDRKIMSYVWHFYSLDFSVTEEDSDEQKRDRSKNMFLQEKKILGRICVPTKWMIPNGTFSHSYYPFHFPLVNQQRAEA